MPAEPLEPADLAAVTPGAGPRASAPRSKLDHPDTSLPPDRDLAVETRWLTKQYRNPWTMKVMRGVEDLSLGVRRGEVLGYLGPNGAGKTTTIKVLAGLHKPTHGQAWLLGIPVEATRSRSRLGFLPEQPYFYEYLNGIEYLEFSGRLSGMSGEEAHRASRQWLDRVGLGAHPKLLLRKYSKGMLQRLGLAAALQHEPELLILDEPMSGLDPFGRRDVRELILEQRNRGVTVMLSSHILPDVEQLCDRVAILLDGRLTRVATLAEIMTEGRQRIDIRCDGAPVVEIPPAHRAYLDRRDHPQETVFTLTDRERLDDVLGWLIRAHVRIRAVTPQRASLEELFMATAEDWAAREDNQRSA